MSTKTAKQFAEPSASGFPRAFQLYILYAGRVSRVKEFLKVFPSLSDKILSQGQQFSSPVENNLGQALPFKSSEVLPESL